ncbi:MAG TPA: hypothetical protein PK339_11285 [Flavitalea sp.]|nr:hypothetical protein [Flavitalea sp.]
MNRWTAVGVHYNDKGNPALANYELVHYAHMKFSVSFIYDSKDRLIELTAPVGYEMDEGFYTTPRRVKYVYQGDSPLPVRDSIFKIGGQEVIEVEDLFYDEQGRINRIVHRGDNYPWLHEYESRYYYDARGNKQVSLNGAGVEPGLAEYGDKPSLYSLHPVWQLIHKDYSINSVKNGAETYNNEGLPLKVNLNAFYNRAAGIFYNRSFLCVENGPDYELSYISYACSELKKQN